jgi:hypothetical protein
MKTLPLTLFIFFALCTSCSKSDVQPTQLLVNGNMEDGTTVANNWYNSYDLGGSITDFSRVWSTQEFSSGSHSLSISRTATPNSTDFVAWAQTDSTMIPIGKTLTLSVKIKGENLVGTGVSIAIRTDRSKTVYDLQFISTQGQTSITGTFDWTTYSVKLTGVQSTVSYIDVYLVYLTNTTGTVYFDDASLTAQ